MIKGLRGGTTQTGGARALQPRIRPLISRLSRREALRYGIAIGSVASLMMIAVFSFRLFEQVQLIVSNLLYTDAPLSGQVVIVAIDDLSLGEFGRSVSEWSRTRHAALIQKLADAGARVVVFDVLFDSPTADDAAFAQAIAAARSSAAGTRVVLAVAGRQGAIQPQGDGPLTYQALLRPVDTLVASGAALGHVNVTADGDSYVRRIPLIMASPGAKGDAPEQWLSLSGAAYLSFLRLSYPLWPQVVKVLPSAIHLTEQRIIPVDSTGRMITNFFGPTGTFPAYSYGAVYNGQIDPVAFRGKIVLVGALNATGVTDRYLVPNGRGGLMAGVEIHANALETLLQNKPLVQLPALVLFLIVIGLAFVSALLFMQFRSWALLVAFSIMLVGGFLIASLLFSLYGIILNLAYPALTITITLIFCSLSNVQVEIRQRVQIQSVLDSLTRLGEQRLLLSDIVPPLIQEARTLLNCDQAALWLWNETRGEVQRIYGWLGAIAPPPTVSPVSSQVIAANVPDSTAWSTYDVAAYQATQMRGIVQFEGALLLALTHNARLVGVIGVDRARYRRFNLVQRDLLSVFTEYITPILANARSYTAELQQRELVESILSGSPDPILVLNDKLRLIQSNAAAGEVSPALAIDKTSKSRVSIGKALQSAGVPAEAVQMILERLRLHSHLEYEIRIGERYFNLLGAPLQINEGAWILVLNNISTLKELDALKTQMLRMASHDLKNPLSIILGYTGMLLSGVIPDSHESVLAIDDAARRMNQIISDIMDIERLRSGRLDLRKSDLSAVVRDVYSEYLNQAVAKAQTLTITVPPAVMARLDVRQMREAIANLVGNAIKYTPTGGAIAVEASVIGQSAVRLTVRDNGLGIAKAAQVDLFKPFYRVRTKATSEIEGTGLGLSIVKAVIDAHHGKIWLDSEEGKGTTFYVELPYTPFDEGNDA